ncbi:MAG: NADPH-dependent glutamate synthase [Candidatus Margulisiibacteriota bacterium]|jgi:glutamate synthase (NADPH/NADH) small chain
MKRNSATEQVPEKRITNFNEVSLGFDEESALNEASRCLNCKKPLCATGCPVNVNIPAFIQLIKEKNYVAALNKIKETNMLPAVCGRVCPQEVQCEGKCVLGIKGESVAIGKLERFVADHGKSENKKFEISLNGHKVAIIGSGPASLTAAADLAKDGFQVTIFEAFHIAGGVLMYGIPEFRLPKEIVQNEINSLKNMGVEFKTNMVIGKILTIDELLIEFSAVFIGVGAGLPQFMNIEGEDLSGVFSANEFLTRVNLMKAYQFPETDTPVRVGKRVVVVGGGNVAMDSARSAKRLGSEVFLVYRRSFEEMPARLEELHHAKEEGIEFMLLTNPVKISGDEKKQVKSITLIKMELSDPDASGRRKPVEVPNSEFDLDADSVIMAIGTNANPLLTKSTVNLQLNKRNNIVVLDEFGQTSIPKVWAGGDIVTGAATVIEAMGAGKKAAEGIQRSILRIN